MSPQAPTTTPFPWETPTPQGPFWSALEDNYNHLGRLYQSVFSPTIIAAMPLDPSLSQSSKLAQLLSLANSHLATNPLLNHPSPSSLSRSDWTAWRDMTFLLAHLEMETGLTTEPEDKYKSLLLAWEKRFDAGTDEEITVREREDVGAMNSLAYLYIQRGMYAQAEVMAIQLPGLLRRNPKLGPGPSPQEMGARRMVMEILARTGRLEEARRANQEGYEVVKEMVTAEGGKFAKYEREEIEALDEVGGKLEGWSQGV